MIVAYCDSSILLARLLGRPGGGPLGDRPARRRSRARDVAALHSRGPSDCCACPEGCCRPAPVSRTARTVPASALLSQATVVVTRDRKMARACSELGLAVA